MQCWNGRTYHVRELHYCELYRLSQRRGPLALRVTGTFLLHLANQCSHLSANLVGNCRTLLCFPDCREKIIKYMKEGGRERKEEGGRDKGSEMSEYFIV